MSVRLIERSDRDLFVKLLQRDDQALPPEAADSLFTTVRADPRLLELPIQTEEDLEQLLKVLDRQLKEVRLDRFDIEEPEEVRRRLVSALAHQHVDRLGLNTSVEALDLPVDPVAPPVLDPQTTTDEKTDTGDQQPTDEDSSGTDRTGVGQRIGGVNEPTAAEEGDDVLTAELDTDNATPIGAESKESESEEAVAHLAALGEVPTAATNGASTDEEDQLRTDDTDTDEEAEPDEPTWDDLGVEIPESDEVADSLGPFGRDVHQRVERWDDQDVEFLVEHSVGIEELFNEGNGVEAGVGVLALARLSFDRPDVLTRHLGAMERAFERAGDKLSMLALISFNQVVRSDPEAVVPYFDSVAKFADSDHPTLQSLALDTVERLSREHPEHLSENHVRRALGGIDSQSSTAKRDAALTLKHALSSVPEAVKPMTGRLVNLASEDDTSSVAALDALRTVAGEYPEAIAPFVDDLLAIQDVLTDRGEFYWLDAMLPMAHETSELDDHVDAFVRYLSEDDFKRTLALNLIAQIALRDTQRVIPHLSEVRKVLLTTDTDDSERRQALSIYLTVADEDVHSVTEDIGLVADQYGHESQTDMIVLSFLSTVAETRPSVVVEYIETAVSALDRSADDETEREVRKHAMFTLGYVSREHLSVVEPYAERALEVALTGEGQTAVAAADLVRNVVDNDPTVVDEHLDRVIDWLCAKDDLTTEETLVAGLLCDSLAGVAREAPETLRSELGTLLDLVGSHGENVDAPLLRCVAHVVDGDGAVTDDHIEALLDAVDSHADAVPVYSAYLLTQLSEEHQDEMIERADQFNYLLTDGSDNEPLAPLTIYRELLPVGADLVSDVLADVVSALDSPHKDVKRSAAEVLNQFARERPSEVTDHLPEITEHLNSPHPECEHQITQVLRHVGEEKQQAIEEYIPELINQLTARDSRVVAGTCLALTSCVDKYADEIAPAAQLLLSRLDDDIDDELAGSALVLLHKLGLENPSYLGSNVDPVASWLTVEEEPGELAAEVLALMSQQEPDKVAEYLDGAVSTLRSSESDAILQLLLLHVSKSDREVVSQHDELILKQMQEAPSVESTDTFVGSKTGWIGVLYHIASERPSWVAERLEHVDPHLSSDSPSIRRRVGAKLLGGVSQEEPTAIVPRLDFVASVIRHRVDGGVFPAVDALYNVAKHDRDAAEEYAELVQELSPDDDPLSSRVEDLERVLRGEDPEDDDDSVPYEELVYNDLDPAAPPDDDLGEDDGEESASGNAPI